jgi:multiple antibiotic resistance protein
MGNILLAFIPVFVAIDVLGVLAIFVSLTHDLEVHKRNRIILQSLLTAATLALGFIFLGKVIFQALGIMVGDFMIAGGAILVCIAIIDLLESEKKRRLPAESLGVVPLGTPLIVGPAVLTTCLIIVDQYGIIASILSVILNLAIVGIVFYFSENIIKVIGQVGAHALSKIMAIFLAAIGVMMIRKGVFFFLTTAG